MRVTYKVRRRIEETWCKRCGGPIRKGDHCTLVDEQDAYHPGCAPKPLRWPRPRP